MQHEQNASIDVFCLAAKKKVEGMQAYACMNYVYIEYIYMCVCIYGCVCAMIVLQLLRVVIAFCCLFEGQCALAASQG